MVSIPGVNTKPKCEFIFGESGSNELDSSKALRAAVLFRIREISDTIRDQIVSLVEE